MKGGLSVWLKEKSSLVETHCSLQVSNPSLTRNWCVYYYVQEATTSYSKHFNTGQFSVLVALSYSHILGCMCHFSVKSILE